jgi:hypothetical protein
MKRIFTFVMAMLCVSMMFAQSNKYEVVGVPAGPEMDRSDWYGWYTQSGYVHVQPAESEYMLYIPAGTFETDVTLEKVRFYTIPSENITNYTGDPFTLDVNFQIRIYTGCSIDGTTFDPGTVAQTQIYNPSNAGAEAGIQLVTLNQPFTVHPTDNVCVAIYCDDRCSMGLCDDDADCAGINFAMWPEYDANAYHHYYWTGGNPAWAYENATVAEHDPWNLSVYYNDGLPYVHKCNWYAEIYDPNDNQTDPDKITALTVDPYTDSIYFYGGAFNKGIDTSISSCTVSIYMIDQNLGNVYFWENEAVGQYDIDTLEVNYGWRFGPFGLVGLYEGTFLDDAEGLSWPLQLCLNIEPNFTDPSTYIDPNLDDNTYCITVDYDNGIQPYNNTVNVFPNPASTAITVENVAGAQVSVFNIAGQEVLSVEAANANETLNVSALPEGMYIVRVVNGTEVGTSKVSIVR